MTNPAARLAAALEGRYTIERELGMGGMAVVHLAHDVRHDRKVALKVLRAELAAILGGERFLKEIRTTANLQHPHILPLHDSGEADGIVYYVMPYVEGESLRDRLIREKQLPVEDAVRITREVADALDYAHRHGVVHRDIKPENILLHDGHVQVADFGIALAVSTAGAGTRMTETGMSLGTPSYMAPEQAMGEREVTPKADIYALGCVLYEMLTGEPPFTGPTAQAIVARVMTEQPRSLTMQRRTIPPNVEAAVATALEKLPADRFGSAAQFAEALGNPAFVATVRGSTAQVVPWSGRAATLPRWRAAASPGVWGLLAIAVGLGLWGWLKPGAHPVPPPLERFVLNFERGDELTDATGSPVAVAPDGSRIVYVGRDSQNVRWLFSRGLERVEPVAIAGTREADQPFFSPDGQWIAFRQDGRLKKVSLSGGAVVTICEAPALFGAWWGPGDVIVFSSQNGLWRVSAAGGQAERLAAADSAGLLRFPHVLPDGRHVLFTRVSARGPSLAVISLKDRTVRPLGQPGMSPYYVDAGFLAFTQSDGTLFAAPFDARRAVITGPPQPVTDNVRTGPAQVAKIGIGRSGALAYLTGSGGERFLVIVDRSGRARDVAAPQAQYRQPRFSPDGRRIAVGIEAAGLGTGDIWVYDLNAGSSTRLTFDSSSAYPEWTPDGRYVVYSRGARSVFALFRVVTDGSGRPETLLVRKNAIFESAFTPDGRWMVFRENDPTTARDIWITRTDSPAAARPLLRTPFEERGIALSPDGRWLAYTSNETGANEVYVRGLAEGSARWRVSTAGGGEPRWARAGRELYYRTSDSVYVVAVPPGATFQHGPPRALFGSQFPTSANNVWYDVSRDGNRFLMVRDRPSVAGGEPMNVVLHWFDQLRAPARSAGAR